MPKLRDQSGVTFATVIFMVMVIGIMLASTGQSWKRLMQREREEELLFRGAQIFEAISSWHSYRPGANISELKQLTNPPKSLSSIRAPGRLDPNNCPKLRQVYLDPITGKDFELVKGASGGIVGVISTSEQEPLKSANFPPEFKHFEGKKKYKEWLFSPAKLRAQLPQSVGTSTPGTLNLPSPFLPDAKDTN